MIVSISEVRKALGRKEGSYTDSQVEEAVGIATVLSDILLDYYIERNNHRREVTANGVDEVYIEKLLRESGKKGNDQED